MRVLLSASRRRAPTSVPHRSVLLSKDGAVKICVEFPSVSYREGPAKMVELARAIEAIGYDDLAMFDHVVMGYATETRRAPIYPSQMPILEALVTLGYVAAVTDRIGLSTEVLVLPQRQAVLVAKQVSTLDTLSGGRVRLGVGVGWQETEYDALGEDFADRGARMEETIGLLRACWGDERIERKGARFHADAIAMEPKPPQGAGLPIWIGGSAPAALRRTGRLGDGWMGSATGDDERDRAAITEIRRHAEQAGRDPMGIELQAMLAPPPRDAGGKTFYQDHDRVTRRAEQLQALGFGWIALNATAIFQAGARSVDAMIDVLTGLHERLRSTLG
jgi:probable F420-dependent oxidoreductase